MDKELEQCKGIVAVLTVDDIEAYLWEDQIKQLNNLLKIIEDSRKDDDKKASRLLIH